MKIKDITTETKHPHLDYRGKRSFKRRELEHELADEGPNNYGIVFPGKQEFWKVVKTRREAERIADGIARSRGEDARPSIMTTAAPVFSGIKKTKEEPLVKKSTSEAPENWGIRFGSSKKFWKVVKSENHAKSIVNTLLKKGREVTAEKTTDPVSS